MTHTVAVPRLFGDDFAQRPDDAYAVLRAAGPVAWAEIAPAVHALVVTSYPAALEVLNNPEVYRKDARFWAELNAGRIPADSPVLPLMAPRPALISTDGGYHARLREVMDSCLDRIDLPALGALTRRHALALVGGVAHRGNAELMSAFADPLPLLIFRDLLGVPDHLAADMVDACHGMITAGPESPQAGADLAACLAQTIHAKRRAPGRDVTTWMLAHPNRLTDEEIIHQLIVFIGAGTVPTSAWIASGLQLLLRGDPDAGELVAGTITVRRALEKVLWTRSPMANFSAHYAVQPTALAPAHVPILISHAATGTDPGLPDVGYGNRAHLAWSAGPHRCPAQPHAAVIAETAIETALDELWDLALVGEPAPNRQGPFHQCPAHLHVLFQPRRRDAQHAAAPATPSGGTA